VTLDAGLLELSHVGKSYPGPAGEVVIVRDFDLRIRRGEFVCLIGHSGCGKSTILSIVMGLSDASAGGVALAGREIDGPGLDRGVVFQSPALLPWLSALENVRLAVDQAQPRKTRGERVGLARRALENVGLRGMEELRPDELSAGMRQRVGIARAFALSPRLLLLDEPFSLLDTLTRMELQDELMRLWESERPTVLMVTHDVDEAILLSDRVVMMTRGPGATIGDVLQVPFPRPRSRAAVFADPGYARVRARLTGFLESQEHALPAGPASALPRPSLDPDVLFAVEKYTGFNRFRRRYRRPRG
jgi:nitrate ABC transporter ATP-binding subunit